MFHNIFQANTTHLYFAIYMTQSVFVNTNFACILSRFQDYLDSEKRYRNDVIVSLRFG